MLPWLPWRFGNIKVGLARKKLRGWCGGRGWGVAEGVLVVGVVEDEVVVRLSIWEFILFFSGCYGNGHTPCERERRVSDGPV